MSSRDIVTIDRLVSHRSSVPAINGKTVDLFLREKIENEVLERAIDTDFNGRIVLFVHGGYCPSTLAFDVPYRDYSWMSFLAQAGYDVFAMDMTGYGRSTRPLMNNPRNLIPRQQHMLVPDVLEAAGEPDYPFELVNSDSESDDINAIVDYICKLRGVERISLIGWSGGGIRCGTYARRYPEKIERLIFHASSNYDRANKDDPPEKLPVPGAPMTIQTRDAAIDQRWLGTCADTASIEPGMLELIWKLNIDHDPVGANWAGGCLRAPTRTYWGWNANAAAAIKTSTLIIVGEQDNLIATNRDLMQDLGAPHKAFVAMEHATHFAVWERQRHTLHEASRQWLADASIMGSSKQYFRADRAGTITAD